MKRSDILMVSTLIWLSPQVPAWIAVAMAAICFAFAAWHCRNSN